MGDLAKSFQLIGVLMQDMMMVHARCSKCKEEGPKKLCIIRDAILYFENPTEVIEVRQ